MKTLYTILLLLNSLQANGQSEEYSDMFDFNLKGSPKSIQEISSFRFDDYLNPKYSSLFKKGINSLFSIDDPSIRTHTTNYQYDYNGNWIVRSTIQDNEITILTQRIINY